MSDGKPYMRLWMRTKDFEKYPELVEAYKRTLYASFLEKYGVGPDWDTFAVLNCADDPLCLPEQKGWSIMHVFGW